MNTTNSKALRSGVWYIISNFITKALVFITTPIFTRLLSKTEYGNYSNYTSWLMILMIIISLNLESTFISAKYDYKNLERYCFSVLIMSTLSSFVWLVLVNSVSQISMRLNINIMHLNIMLIYILFLAALNIFQVYQRYTYKYKTSVFLSLLISFFTTILSIVLVNYSNDKLTARIVGSALPTIVIGAIIYIYLAIKSRGIDLSTWKYAIKICLPYIPHLLSLNLLNSIDRTMITDICGPEKNAIYSVAYTCGAIVTTLLQSLNTAYSPWLGDKLHKKEYKQIRSFSYVFIGSCMYITLIIMLFGPEIMYILGGKKYLNAIYVLAPVAMGCFCQMLYTMFVNIEQFSKKTIGMAFASVSAAVLNIVSNIVFIPKFGYVAAAYTTLAGFLWLLIVHMFLVKRIGFKMVYNYGFVIVAVIVMMLVMLCMNLIYLNNIIRYGIIMIMILFSVFVILKYKKQLQKIIIQK